MERWDSTQNQDFHAIREVVSVLMVNSTRIMNTLMICVLYGVSQDAITFFSLVWSLWSGIREMLGAY
jgi:hypothetical protein